MRFVRQPVDQPAVIGALPHHAGKRYDGAARIGTDLACELSHVDHARRNGEHLSAADGGKQRDLVAGKQRFLHVNDAPVASGAR